MKAAEGRDGCLDLAALFGNDFPVEVDLGCGKGAFMVEEALARSKVNFIGIDYITRKLARALRRIKEQGLQNVRVFRSDVFLFVNRFLPPASTSVFHIYFPDPWPKKRHRKHRFITPPFVDALAAVLRIEGTVWIATDSKDYYGSILELFQCHPALRSHDPQDQPARSITDYERSFLEKELPIYSAGFLKRR